MHQSPISIIDREREPVSFIFPVEPYDEAKRYRIHKGKMLSLRDELNKEMAHHDDVLKVFESHLSNTTDKQRIANILHLMKAECDNSIKKRSDLVEQLETLIKDPPKYCAWQSWLGHPQPDTSEYLHTTIPCLPNCPRKRCADKAHLYPANELGSSRILWDKPYLYPANEFGSARIVWGNGVVVESASSSSSSTKDNGRGKKQRRKSKYQTR
jgi:hypothetical protein